MQLREQIKNYYFKHLDELPADKRFHFASRLAAWENNPQAKAELITLKTYMTGGGQASQTLAGIMERPIGHLYAKQLRRPYFDKYPDLFGIHNALFRLRHLKVIYGIDWRSEFLKIAGESKLEQLYSGIINDKPALRILSRFAVDYLLLYEILLERPGRFDPEEIQMQFDKFDSNDNEQLHLLIYLFTHTIIADSNFYARALPAGRLETYRDMLRGLEPLLESRGGKIKLDAKFEFLVAGRICGYASPVYSRIIGKASENISPHGMFIIDPLNGGPEAGINGFARSEHRNVLYIMANSGYRPRTVSII